MHLLNDSYTFLCKYSNSFDIVIHNQIKESKPIGILELIPL